MVLETKPITIQEFKRMVAAPEYEGRLFELINGEMREVSPGRTYNSGFGLLLGAEVLIFCREHNIPCYMSGEAGAYSIKGHVLVPDFAYKPTPLSDDYPDPEPPLWVLEVISPTDKPSDIRDKRQIYRDAGILYWEMYPQKRIIDVYAPGHEARTVVIDGTLDGGDVLPNFRLAMRDLFP